MAFQLLFLEFLLGGAILGGLVAYRKSVGERIVLFATVPIAYFVAYLLMRAGVFDFIGTSVLSALSGIEGLSSFLEGSAATASGIAALINCIVRPLLLVPVFWILLLVLRIVWAIVAKATSLREKVAFFHPCAKKSVWKNLGISLIGAFGGFVICMLSLLPVTYFSNLVTPALENIQKEQYNGTYVQAQSEVVNTTLLPLAKHTVPGALQTYTGLRFVMDASAHGLGEVSLCDNNGNEVTFNGTEFVQTLAKDGTCAAAIYEFTCHPSRYTFADMAPIAEILSDLAQSKPITVIGSEILSGSELSGEGDDLGGQLVSSLIGEYTSGDAAVLENDLQAVAAMVALLAEDLGEVSLESEDLATELLTYLADEEAAYRVVDILTDFHVYGEVFGMLAEYGVDALAEALDVSEDRSAHHDKYVLALLESLNDRTTGTYDREGVDAFIRYAAENDIKVGDYATENENSPTVTDIAYRNYLRYIEHANELEAILASYTGAAQGNSYYVASDGSVYTYDKKTDKWSLCEDETALCGTSYLAQLLLHKTDGLLIENAERVFVEADLSAFGTEIAATLAGKTAGYEVATVALATTLTDENAASFAPNVVYRTDILEKLHADIAYGEEENRQFAAIIATATDLFGNIMDAAEGDDPIAAIMDEFSSIGRLLDGLSAFAMTEDVPEQMLKAIMQHDEYGKYFDSDSVTELIEKVKNGTATYESLFDSVQALYGIINQVIPQ